LTVEQLQNLLQGILNNPNTTQPVKDIVNNLQNTLNGASGPVLEAITKALSGLVTSGVSVVDLLKNVATALGGALNSVESAAGSAGVALVQTLVSGLNALTAGLSAGLNAAAVGVQGLVTTLVAALQDLQNKITDPKALELVKQLLIAAQQGLLNNPLTQLLKNGLLSPTSPAQQILTQLQNVVDKSLVPAVTGALNGLLALLTSPLTVLLNALTGLLGGLVGSLGSLGGSLGSLGGGGNPLGGLFGGGASAGANVNAG
jgi:phage-related protein